MTGIETACAALFAANTARASLGVFAGLAVEEDEDGEDEGAGEEDAAAALAMGEGEEGDPAASSPSFPTQFFLCCSFPNPSS